MKIVNPVITSRKNSLIIETAALHEKKYRYEQGLFLIEGEKLVKEAAEHRLPIVRVFLSEGRAAEILPRLQERMGEDAYAETSVYTLSDDCFSKISSEKAPQGVIAVLKHLDIFERKTIIYDEDICSLGTGRVVMLYAMQDPGNLGAVIRSAVAFGVDCILLSADCADLYNSKTIRAAMGSLFRVRIWAVEDVAGAISALQRNGRRVWAAELRDGAVALSEAPLQASDCIIIGNEGHGIPPAVSSLCTGSVYLPISQRAESLNAAVAAAIFLWEQSQL